MDDDFFADIYVTPEAPQAEPPVEPSGQVEPPAGNAPSPTTAPVSAESGTAPAVVEGTAPAVPEAEPLSPEARAQQLEAQLAEVKAARDSLQGIVDQDKAAKDAAKAAQDAAALQEQIRRENGIAKSIYQGFVDEGEPKKAQAFAWMHDQMTRRINEFAGRVEDQTKAINAYVYTTQVFAPEAFAAIIEVGDSVSHLSGDEMIAAVNSIRDSQLSSQEGSLQDKQKIASLEAELASLKAQSTDPKAHLVEGGPSQPGQKPESEWTFEDHWNHARGVPVGVGAS